jgi:hypothetical protein
MNPILPQAAPCREMHAMHLTLELEQKSTKETKKTVVTPLSTHDDDDAGMRLKKLAHRDQMG